MFAIMAKAAIMIMIKIRTIRTKVFWEGEGGWKYEKEDMGAV
jgi:hypothetical protein